MSKIYTTTPHSVILSTIIKIEDYIKCTYGSAGRGILVDNGLYQSVVDDGFQILEELEFDDELENTVLSFVKEATRQTNKKAGDATTTSVIILCALVKGALSDLEYKVDIDYVGIAEEIQNAIPEAVKIIRKSSKKITTIDELEKIAFNAYKNKEISKMIAEIVNKIGHEGKIEITESDTPETSFEVVTGMTIEKGYVSPQMTDDNKDIKLKKPLIIIVNEDLIMWSQIKSLVENLVKNEIKNALLICDNVSGEALNGLVVNNLPTIRVSGFGAQRLEILKDIAVLTGATVVSSSQFTMNDAGTAEIVTVGMEETLIVGGKGNKEEIKKRVESIRPQIKVATPQDKIKLETRIAKLTGGVAVIKVGAHVDTRVRAMKMKIDDAVHATQLAKKGGKVLGAGLSLYVTTNSKLLNTALRRPHEILIQNGKKYLTEGVYDATEVVVSALETSVSVASELISCGGIISFKKEKDEE